MKQVVYTGTRIPGKVRMLRIQDLDRLGVKHKGESLVWNPENRYTIVMSNQMSDSLVEMLPNEFAAYDAEGDDESLDVQDAATSLASGPQGSVPGSPDVSLPSETDDEQSSPRSRAKSK